jgi:hypothetical protein
MCPGEFIRVAQELGRTGYREVFIENVDGDFEHTIVLWTKQVV